MTRAEAYFILEHTSNRHRPAEKPHETRRHLGVRPHSRARVFLHPPGPPPSRGSRSLRNRHTSSGPARPPAGPCVSPSPFSDLENSKLGPVQACGPHAEVTTRRFLTSFRSLDALKKNLVIPCPDCTGL